MIARDLIPNFLSKKLWGDREKYGFNPVMQDPQWIEWQERQLEFYKLNQRKGIGSLVNDSGYVSLPVLGEIYVSGKSLEEAEKIIKNIANDYFSNPFVKLVLLNFNVTVLGEVVNPGSINIFEPSINLLDIIGKVNGFTQMANRKKIKIIRLGVEKPEIFYVDLTDKKVANSNKFFIKPGDIIYVEPIEKRFFVVNNISTALSTIISSLTLYFLLTNE